MRAGDRVRLKQEYRGPDGGQPIGTIVYVDSIRKEYWVRWGPCMGSNKVQGYLLERINILEEIVLKTELSESRGQINDA